MSDGKTQVFGAINPATAGVWCDRCRSVHSLQAKCTPPVLEQTVGINNLQIHSSHALDCMNDDCQGCMCVDCIAGGTTCKKHEQFLVRFKGEQKPTKATRTVATVEKSHADRVNHPPHYTAHPSGVECITITEHMGFNLGNAVKYIWRADLKNDSIEDLKKAAWYIARELKKREKVQK